jgi:hypothetical protein
MVRSEELDGFSELRLPIFDDVAFVEDAVVPVDGAKLGDVVSDDVVGHDDDVVLCDLGKEGRSILRRANIEERLKVGRELEDLVVPVTGEGRRAYDDRGEMD